MVTREVRIKTPIEIRTELSDRALRLCAEKFGNKSAQTDRISNIIKDASTTGVIQFWIDRIKFGLI